jgi:hypothetical protein
MMLAWFNRLWPRSGSRGRVVFRYWSGEQWVGGDPLRLKAALDSACPEWPRMTQELLDAETASGLGAAALGEKLSAELDRRRGELAADLVRAVRAAFGVHEYQSQGRREQGLTDLECLALLADYLAWVADVMEETRPLALSPPRTEPAAARSATDSGSGSPSTHPPSGPSTPT